MLNVKPMKKTVLAIVFLVMAGITSYSQSKGSPYEFNDLNRINKKNLTAGEHFQKSAQYFKMTTCIFS
jgi:hypothetical protein